MGRIDPNLRAVLDSLSIEKGVRHPTADLEFLKTIVNRLGGGHPGEADHGHDAHREGEVPETAERPEHLEAELRATQEERDELARRYAELEARIARLEGGPAKSGGLSFDDGPTLDEAPHEHDDAAEVRFQRVDPPAPRPSRAQDPYAYGADPYDVRDDVDPFAPAAHDDEDLMEFEPSGGDRTHAPSYDGEGWQVGEIPAAGHEEWNDDDLSDAEAGDAPAPSPQGDGEYEALMRELADLERDLNAIGTGTARGAPAREAEDEADDPAAARGDSEQDADVDAEADDEEDASAHPAT